MKKRNIREIGEKILGKFAMMGDLIEMGKIWHTKEYEIELKKLLIECDGSLRILLLDLLNEHKESGDVLNET